MPPRKLGGTDFGGILPWKACRYIYLANAYVVKCELGTDKSFVLVRNFFSNSAVMQTQNQMEHHSAASNTYCTIDNRQSARVFPL